MPIALRRLAAILLASAAIVLPVRAGSLTVDFSDLWWNDPNDSESGWGVNVVQQSDTLFLTFFIYGADNAARWVVAPAMKPSGQQQATSVRFEGDLYQTRGPWFGGAFDPSKVEREKVGTATINFDSVNTADLTYTVGTTSVAKRVRRQSFRANSVAGVYGGGILAIASKCAAGEDNGSTYFWGTTTVTQTDFQITLKVDFRTAAGAPALCTFVGAPETQGRLAAVKNGTFSCTVGNTTYNKGNFNLAALDSQMNGFHASFTGTDQYCTYNGTFGGTRLPGT